MNFVSLQKLDPTLNLIHGNPSSEIRGISHSEDPKEGTFCFVKSIRFQNFIGARSQDDSFIDSGIVLEEKFYKTIENKDEIKTLQKKFGWIATVKDVNFSMVTMSKPFYDKKFSELNMQVDGRQMGSVDIDPDAEIAQNVFIGEDVTIASGVKIFPGVVIMAKTQIGEGTIIFPNTTIYPYTKIGKNCRIHAQVTIGADGFGYNFYDGVHKKVWHFSGVKIGDDVEIGANSTVDAGAFCPTTIGNGCKIDNDVSVGHNVIIGDHCVICGKCGLAGSSVLGNYVVMGGSSGTFPGARLGDGVQLAAMTIVHENKIIEKGTVLAGDPAIPLKKWLKYNAKLRMLTKEN